LGTAADAALAGPRAAGEVASGAAKATGEVLTNARKAISGFSLGTPRTPVEKLTRAYEKSFIKNDTGVLDALDDLAARASKRPGIDGTKTKVTAENLITNLAEEEYVPKLRGKTADFREVFDDIGARQQKLMTVVDPYLEKIAEKTSIYKLGQQVKDEMKASGRFSTNLSQAQKQVDTYIENLIMTYGDEIDAKTVNTIRKELTSKSGAYDKATFEQDSAEAFARVLRERLDELDKEGTVKALNRQWGALEDIKSTAMVFSNKPVKVNELLEAVGSVGGTALAGYTGALAGYTGLMFGPSGSLAASAAIARIGAKVVTNIIRTKRFNTALADEITSNLKADAKLLTSILEKATPEEREVIEAALNAIK
jgi:hypothetical protein